MWPEKSWQRFLTDIANSFEKLNNVIPDVYFKTKVYVSHLSNAPFECWLLSIEESAEYYLIILIIIIPHNLAVDKIRKQVIYQSCQSASMLCKLIKEDWSVLMGFRIMRCTHQDANVFRLLITNTTIFN